MSNWPYKTFRLAADTQAQITELQGATGLTHEELFQGFVGALQLDPAVQELIRARGVVMSWGEGTGREQSEAFMG